MMCSNARKKSQQRCGVPLRLVQMSPFSYHHSPWTAQKNSASSNWRNEKA